MAAGDVPQQQGAEAGAQRLEGHEPAAAHQALQEGVALARHLARDEEVAQQAVGEVEEDEQAEGDEQRPAAPARIPWGASPTRHVHPLLRSSF